MRVTAPASTQASRASSIAVVARPLLEQPQRLPLRIGQVVARHAQLDLAAHHLHQASPGGG